MNIRAIIVTLGLFSSTLLRAQSTASYPYPDKLTYEVEWRLISAGTAEIETARGVNGHGWTINTKIESAGLVSRLYHVLDNYKVSANDAFCLSNAFLDAQEGKKHTQTQLNSDGNRKKLSYEERDLIKNAKDHRELDVDSCTYEIAGALLNLRANALEPGKSINIPISDGKKFVRARIEAQGKETLNVSGKSYSTTRYEAFLFDNVLYRKRGRLLLWISDDAERIPVTMRVLMGFPIGTITIQLQKYQKG